MKPLMSTMLAAVVATLGASGCGAPGDEPVAVAGGALLGGSRTSARPEVGKYNSPFGGYCTLSMISSRTFVTAAHCHNYAPMSTGGTVDLPDAGLIGLPVERTFSQGGQLGNDDIAFGRLTTPVTSVVPASIATAEPSNTWLTAIGYGCTDSFEKGCTTGGNKTYFEYFYTGSASAVNAPGDSGGPTFVGQLADRGPMVRIASGRYVNPLIANDTHDIGADAVAYRNHILAMDTALNGNGVSYRAHVQDNGWMPAVQGATTVGLPGGGKRVEALQVWSPLQNMVICYTAHVQDIGWQQEYCDGAMAGTTGQSKRLEAFKMRLAAKPAGSPIVGIQYNAYVQGQGWQGWRYDGAIAGTTGQGLRIEAIVIALHM
jgi:hypothetical protein